MELAKWTNVVDFFAENVEKLEHTRLGWRFTPLNQLHVLPYVFSFKRNHLETHKRSCLGWFRTSISQTNIV